MIQVNVLVCVNDLVWRSTQPLRKELSVAEFRCIYEP